MLDATMFNLGIVITVAKGRYLWQSFMLNIDPDLTRKHEAVDVWGMWGSRYHLQLEVVLADDEVENENAGHIINDHFIYICDDGEFFV